jgi:uncharacterized repeat protein (TIGR03833 family)
MIPQKHKNTPIFYLEKLLMPIPNVPKRSEIQPGIRVQIVEKQNQSSGQLTEGIVARILTSSPTHPHGIKVMLVNGKVGRVQAIVARPEN